MSGVTASAQWAALCRHADEMRSSGLHLRHLFADDPNRGERHTVEMADLLIDFSRHLVTDHTLDLLSALSEEAGVVGRLEAMLRGEAVNSTERRPALHTAVRAVDTARDSDVAEDRARSAARTATAERERMAAFVGAVRSGERRGSSGKRFRAAVSIGIGGSHLGPAMACEALDGFTDERIGCRFASNVDPCDLAAALRGLDPAETLFVVISKSFTTAETLANARSARAWVESALGDDAAGAHFAAVTADPDAATRFGIAPEDVFAMWDWVGGRFSIASSAGLALMLAIGEDRFDEMLHGMRLVDEHLGADPRSCAPVRMGLLSVWNRNFMGSPARAILPYAARLRRLPAYLQQLIMESNGKRVRLDGTLASCDTAEIVVGGTGTDSQHSFHQLLHQGTTTVAADFIVFARPDRDVEMLDGAVERHETLVANCFAQAEALAFGAPVSADDPLRAHRELPGNRPCTVIMAPRLTPCVLGQLIALYEHQTAVQAALWEINSFDQFGVEHGKSLATRLSPALAASTGEHAVANPSTASLIDNFWRLRNAEA